MATIVTRDTGATAKGSPLSNLELDNNFININTELATKLSLDGGTMNNTNLVTNLNADLFDGQHSAYYLDYNNLNNVPSYWARTFMLMGV